MSWSIDHGHGSNMFELATVGLAGGVVHGQGTIFFTHVYTWNGAADTQIWSTNPGIGYDFAVYYGSLYAAIKETIGGNVHPVVYRYNGSPDNWTRVDDPGYDSGVSGFIPFIGASYDSSRLLSIPEFVDTPGTVYIRSSPDGTVWTTDTVAGVIRVSGPRLQPTALGDYILAVVGGSDYRVYKRNGTTWNATSGNIYGVYDMLTARGSGFSVLHAYRIADNALMYSTDDGASWDVAATPTQSGGARIFAMAGYEFLTTNGNVYQWNRATNDWDLYDAMPASNYAQGMSVYGGELYLARMTSQFLYVNDAPLMEVSFTVPVNWSPTAMSVSPDDYYAYVGVLDDSSNPVLLQLLSDLTADPIKAYDPGAGSAIGVQCADLNEEWVWIAGAFGGTIKVRVSIDDGATWSTRDPGSWSGVALPLVVGPDDDNLVLVPTDGDDNLFETEDGGLNWATLNAALPFDVNGMDRLDLNLDEIMMGSDAGRSIRYSPNNGATLHDLSDVAMANVRVSDLIIG